MRSRCRYTWSVLKLVAIAAAAATVAGGAYAARPHSDVDFVVGDGKTSTWRFHFGAFAASGGVSEEAEGSGSFVARAPLHPRVELRITCLRVHGRRATIGGVITTGRRPVPLEPSPGAVFVVEDNGSEPDRMSRLFRQPVRPAVCPPPDPRLLRFRLREGDIVVHN